jgi:uncharacterized protein (DUF924 family)
LKSSDILNFWFNELSAQDWCAKNDKLDQLITTRFQNVHQQASSGELWRWRRSPQSSLAEIIILDQFSRNMFRNDPRAFSYDSMALTLAQNLVEKSWLEQLNDSQKAFALLPYMHSESAIIHQQAVELFSESGLESNLSYELKHQMSIQRFGRYPHRNALLSRESTTEEQEFLLEKDSSF